MTYSKKFKKSMVRKLAGPNAPRRADLADEVGVHHSTLSRWVQEFGTVGSMSKMKIKEIQSRPEDKTGEEKLQLVLEASQLSDDKLGAFLRKSGIHEAQLERWRSEALGGLSGKPSKTKAKKSPEKKRIKELEKELRRKDKALAEAAALLILQKKVEALWGDGEDDIG